MAREIVLDLGIGSGGRYLDSLEGGAILVGLDRKRTKLLRLQKNHPQVLALEADPAQTGEVGFPLGWGVFDQVNILFPYDSLLYGLCHLNDAYTHFPEIARVLKPEGSLTIYGDNYLVKDFLLSHASKFFEPIGGFKSVSRETLREIGTETCQMYLDLMRRDLNTRDYGLFKIDLRKTAG